MSKARVQFHTIRYKNFMAVGEQWVEVQLDANDKTIIYGKNGSGKSTVYEALYFCLFNKAFRKINKPDLVNNINNKGLSVEVEFSIGSTEYRVVRGIKPNVFEIYRDGVMLDQTSSSADYQTILESQILRMGPKNAGQTMILGSKMYTPFMKLSASDRRALIEEILDIQIFSEMNTITKNRVKLLKEDHAEVLHETELLQARMDGLRNQIETIEVRNAKEIEEAQNDISTLEDNIAPLQEEFDRYVAQGMALKEDYDKIEDVDMSTAPPPDYSGIEETDPADRKAAEEKLNLIWVNKQDVENKLQNAKIKLSNAQSNHQTTVTRLQKDMQFYTDNPICPTCKQETHGIGEQTVIKLQGEIAEADAEREAAEKTGKETIDKYTNILEVANQVEKEQKDLIASMDQVDRIASEEKLRRDLAAKAALQEEQHRRETERARLSGEMSILRNNAQNVKAQMDRDKARIETLQKRIDSLSVDTDLETKKDQLETMTNDFAQKFADMKAMKTDLEEYDLILKLLKDDGIKQRIVKTYIPVINKLIRKYLDILGFSVGFSLDESFKETISVPGRRDLQYGSFSAGEQMRIDLALLFAFREIPIIKGGNTCNLMVFDEVADSALDVEGWDAFFTIIESITDISNVFVISPKGDELTNRFNNSIQFKKAGSFTQMEID